MNKYVAVTVRIGQRSADLALPVYLPAHTLLENLLPLLGVASDDGKRWSLSQKTPGGLRRIPDSARLSDLEITHGTILMLIPEETAHLAVTNAYLEAKNGERFILDRRSMVLGRNDPKSGTFVEIDLSTVADHPKAISRRHARIDQKGDRFYLTDLGSTNGTRLNGICIPPHEKKPLWDGDVIVLGRDAICLTFHYKQGPRSNQHPTNLPDAEKKVDFSCQAPDQ